MVALNAELRKVGGGRYRVVTAKHGHERFCQTLVTRVAAIHFADANTVGAEADDGFTQLELDLARIPKAPTYFREH